MSRVFSFRDLKLIPELSQYSEIEMLHPILDETINKYLSQVGFDIEAGVIYVPAKHRDLQGNVGVGFRATGTVTTDPGWFNNPLCDSTERLIAAVRTDISLAKELCRMLGHSVDLTSNDIFSEDPNFPTELEEDDYEEVSNQIKQLEEIRDFLRGSPYNEFGAIKSPSEYKTAN